MGKSDLFQILLGIFLFAIPFVFLVVFAVGLEDMARTWHTEFLLFTWGLAILFGFYLVKRIVANHNDRILGTLILAAAYVTLVTLVLDAFLDLYDPFVYPLFLGLLGFLLIYPLIEWFALVDVKQQDAMLPLQLKVDHFLEKITRGNKPRTIGFYLLVYGSSIILINWLFQNMVLSILLITLILPLINIGYLTGRNLGDDLLWWKAMRKKDEKPPFRWLAIDWEQKHLRVFQNITLGNKILMVLGVVLVASTIYGVYTDIIGITTPFVVSTGVGIVLIAKILLLSGRNAVNETQKLWNATRVKATPSRFSLFYPIYVGVSILLIVAVEFLVNLPASVEQLANGLGIAFHRQLLVGVVLLEELTLLIAVGMVIFTESTPMAIREVSTEEFRMISPVEQHLAVKKIYKDAQTLPSTEERFQALEQAVRHGTELLNAAELLSFLISPYDRLKTYARTEVERLVRENPMVGEYYLKLLESGSLPFVMQELVTELLAFSTYLAQLQRLVHKGKLRAKWLTKTLTGHKDVVTSVWADEQYVYVGSGDTDRRIGEVKVWDKQTFRLVTTLANHVG
ncbi:MAG: hypothetical protein ACE5I5_18005, partial [Candidatus Heimdallarchaeota archaeon]